MTSTTHTQVIHDYYTESGEHIVSRDVTIGHVGKWLKNGWLDMAHAPLASLFYGAVMMFSVMAVYSVFHNQPIMMFKIATFFVMLTPFLATGLYAISAQLHRGQPPQLRQSMFVWRHNVTEFALFALFLGVVVAIWGRIVPLIAAIAQSDSLLIVNPEQGVMSFLTSDAGQIFTGYFFVGALAVSALIFALSVVTIPLLLRDRNIGFVQAMILSFKTTMHNKGVMLVWALTIGALITIGMLSLGLGMLIVMPLLGYASWHAFCDLIEVDDKRQNDEIEI